MTTPSRRLPTTLRGRKVYKDSPRRADAGSRGVATCRPPKTLHASPLASVDDVEHAVL